jgi:hypothetical protein
MAGQQGRTTAPPPGAPPRLMHSNATYRGRANIPKRPNRLNVRSGSVAGPPPSFAAADQAGLVRIIKRKLNKIQYRPHLINGCLAATGLRTGPW